MPGRLALSCVDLATISRPTWPCDLRLAWGERGQGGGGAPPRCRCARRVRWERRTKGACPAAEETGAGSSREVGRSGPCLPPRRLCQRRDGRSHPSAYPSVPRASAPVYALAPAPPSRVSAAPQCRATVSRHGAPSTGPKCELDRDEDDDGDGREAGCELGRSGGRRRCRGRSSADPRHAPCSWSSRGSSGAAGSVRRRQEVERRAGPELLRREDRRRVFETRF